MAADRGDVTGQHGDVTQRGVQVHGLEEGEQRVPVVSLVLQRDAQQVVCLNKETHKAFGEKKI